MANNMKRGWLGLAAVALAALLAAGCGGDDGATGPQGEPGSTGGTGPAGPAGPPGATGTLNAQFITPEEWEASNFSATVNSVTIASPPVVEFTVIDERGRPLEGLEQVTSTGDGRGGTYAAGVKRYPNIELALAKLMPRTDARPAPWVSYIVTTVPLTTSPNVAATRPSTDTTGKLEAMAGKAGSYKYTFYRDVPGTKSVIDGLTYSGNNRKEDLGDLTWEPTLPHRLTIQIGGAAPGTGSNTSNGVQTTAAVNMANPVNVTHDFVPSTGQVLTAAQLTREDVSIDNCNVCHNKLAFHGGSARVETRYCVVCHTDQRAYGRARATSTATASAINFPALTETATVNAVTGITSYSYTPDTYVADGEVAGNFTTMIHKIHQGHTLVKQNYHYAGLAFNNKGFSKLGEGQKMCTTCHGGAEATTASNYREIPSRKSCGACHDGIKWDTGSGSTLGDKMKVVYAGDALPATGHLGGAYQDDASCKSCHSADGIKISHRTENITKNNPEITAGLATFRYEIKSVAVNATTNDLTIEFGIWKKVSPSTTESLVTFVAPAASFPNLPGTTLAGGPLQPDFSGSPSFLLPYAVSQDGITKPADFNNVGPGRTSAQPRGVSITNLLTTTNSLNGNVVPSTANPGYYTATILGSGQWAFPAGAASVKMRAVALQGYFNQVTPPASTTAANGRHAISVMKEVAGDTVRRKIVDAEKCAGCHEWFEGHGGNRVYETQVCTACHVPGLATSGRGIEDGPTGTFPGLNNWNFDIASTKIVTDWGFNKTLPNAALKFPVTTNNLKDMVHGIHAGRDRASPFQDARNRTSTTSAGGGVIQLLDFRRMDFPGKLNNCENCHVTGTAAATTFNTIPLGALASTYESIDATYAAGIAGVTATPLMAKNSLSQPNVTDIVTTPWAGACVSCHDGSAAKAHMDINGGQINVVRSKALPAGRALEDVESCSVCHGPGRDFDAAKVHK